MWQLWYVYLWYVKLIQSSNTKTDWLIVWCLALFSTVFHLHPSGQCTYLCFPWVLLTSTPHNVLSMPLATFPLTHCQKMDNGERGMNPGAMTISNPQKEYWPSRDQTSDLLFSSPVGYRLSYGHRQRMRKDHESSWVFLLSLRALNEIWSP